MDGIEEVKKIFAETQEIIAATRNKVEDMDKKSADYVDADTLGKMKADLAAKMSAADAAVAEMKARMEALETKTNRPGGKVADETPEAKAMSDYLRKGVEPPAEIKAMATSSNVDGGYLVPVVIRDGIQARLRRTSPVRAVASVIGFAGSSYDIIVERGDAGFEWAGEPQTRAETDTATINRISIPLHELSAMPKLSQRLLDNASFDIEGWMTGRISDRFARAEATAFVTGDGANKPKGFMAYAKATTADDTRAQETLQYRFTGSDGSFGADASSANGLVKLFYDLQPAYQLNASWMMKNTTLADVAVLKDSDGSFLLRELLNGDGSLVRTIMGRPAYQADDMPAIGSGTFSIAVGDFAQGYTIIENPAMSILRDPFSAKPNVLFYATKRIGGGVTDFDAIKLLRFATS